MSTRIDTNSLQSPANSGETGVRYVSAWFDPLLSVAVIIATYFALARSSLSDVNLSLAIILATTVCYFTLEYARAPWKWSDRPRTALLVIFDRVNTKFLGILVGIAFILLALWLFPEYDNVRTVALVHNAALPFLAFVLPVSFAFVFFAESALGERKDGTYNFGLLARMRFQDIDWNVFLDGVLEWLVRCIFLLINFVSAAYFLSMLRSSGLPSPSDGFVQFVMRADSAIFALILFSILPGYIFASRIIGTEVKRVDHTWFGWAVTLAAYSPLNAAVFTDWIRYEPSAEMTKSFNGLPAWAAISGDHAWLIATLGALIIALAIFHLWGEAQMGIRSSNLSMRGIIATGPFKITKHPVYVSKCLQWALIYLPFLNAAGILGALQSGILFFLVCVLFAGRAVAEEKLLAEDPAYVAYALAMDENSIFAFVGRTLPFMRFAWRYDFWMRNGYLPTTSPNQLQRLSRNPIAGA